MKIFSKTVRAVIALCAVVALAACRPEAPAPVPLPETSGGATPDVTAGIETLAAELIASDPDISGAAVLTADNGDLILAAALDGLTPGAYAIHVHDGTDCAGTNSDRAGPRYSRPGEAERLADSGQPPAGAFGGFDVGSTRQAKFSIEKSAELEPAQFLGLAVVVHAGADSASGEPTGRLVACGVLKPIAR
ncbi:MAG: superoxide dismutase family protein [Pseudomonadota bacterium]